MATKEEIQKLIIDALKREMDLFDIYSVDDFPGNTSQIWMLYGEEEGRTGGRTGSMISYDNMQKLRNYYLGGTENDLQAVNDLLSLIRGKSSKDSNSRNAVVSGLIADIQANPNYSDEEKQLLIDSVIRGYSDEQRMVPKLDTSDPTKFDVYEYQDGQLVEDTFGGHFGAGMEGVYELALNPQTIMEFQDLLEDEGLVPEGTFKDTYGQKSNTLRTELAKLMLWIDSNEYAVYGTSDYNNVMQQDLQQDGGVFSHSSYLVGENLYHQKLLNYFVGDYVSDVKNNKAIFEADATKERLKRFMEQAPGPLEMENIIENAYFSMMNRRGTQSEIDEWGKKLASNYTDYFNDLNNMYNQIANVNMIQTPTMGWEVAADEMQNLFVDSPEFRAEEEFQQEYQDEISLATRAQDKRNQQEAMLRAMFGG